MFGQDEIFFLNRVVLLFEVVRHSLVLLDYSLLSATFSETASRHWKVTSLFELDHLVGSILTTVQGCHSYFGVSLL